MVSVSEQYEVYPYPERDPADEAKRLVTGSPSHPLEMDHFLWGGARDWSLPLRILVAGGGTGDGTIQMAQILTDAGAPYEITYLDLSAKARGIAEARAAARGLEGIAFHTGSLLDAPDFGAFDYIDSCGVLHHLPEPEAGFRALRAALAPGGAAGIMVYAPHGRSGVYPLQSAFGTLFEGLPPEARLARARALMDRLPEGHPFRVNPNLGDHRQSDAGFYDLLLHSQDRAYDVTELADTLAATGWQLASFATPALYDLARLVPDAPDLDPVAAMAVAEQLRGTIKVHNAYLVAGDAPRPAPASGRNRALRPHLRGVDPRALARAIAGGKTPRLRAAGESVPLRLPREAAPLIAAIDGRRALSRIAAQGGLDPLAFWQIWSRVEAALSPWGILLYSDLHAGRG
ncbi:Ubiquinone/menaquinone biosynthesis C-methylase UbiE [Roseivivax lentus]|uniref:Ubiquinone/menaquinone biosynthesis C-methylase UbiE n=1 Tax=Roseivivax lentus TaxID=633194 RepID=A0A1N7L7E5_9RHOB|nr:class I SAM-dependent methyltransferase [Roseivivax lentus]SIS69758.1 Ubiquinone/menaquinone biosynthesis C-methylase UbiE [Roseivivax lentus]